MDSEELLKLVNQVRDIKKTIIRCELQTSGIFSLTQNDPQRATRIQRTQEYLAEIKEIINGTSN